MENEIWKEIEGTNGFYEISNLGRVKSTIFRNGKVEYRRERIMASSPGRDGYLIITLSTIRKTTGVARLVAKAFIPNPENKFSVNHKNAIKTDNRAENLEWATTREQHAHAKNMGLTTWNASVLSEEQIREIKRRISADERPRYRIADDFKVSSTVIYKIEQGKLHKDIH